MYYHLMMKDGLKYKDLSIEEIEKIIDEKKLSYNNSALKYFENEVKDKMRKNLVIIILVFILVKKN